MRLSAPMRSARSIWSCWIGACPASTESRPPAGFAQTARSRRIPAIVIVTAFGREEVRTEAEDAGVDGFLVKPVNQSMLVDTLVEIFAPEHRAAAREAVAGHDI